MAVTRQKTFPYTVTIDGEPVRLLLRRMTPPEFEEFRAMFASLGQHRGAPPSYVARVVAEQRASAQEKASGAEPVPLEDSVTINDIRAEASYLKANAEWQEEVFDAYVTVQAGDVLDEGEVITNGRQFAAMFAGHPMIPKILAELYLANALTAAQKKTLQSLSDSRTGSPDAPVPGAGETPAPTAAPAAREDSAPAAAAMAPPSGTSSGTTDPSSFEVVPCAI